MAARKRGRVELSDDSTPVCRMGPGGRTGAGAGVGAGAGARVQQSTAVAPLRKPQFKRLSAVDHAAGVHERNRYKNAKPDFAALAIKYPDFAKL